MDPSLTDSVYIAIPTPQTGNWYIGVYGFQQCNFILSAVASKQPCVSQCSGHGDCVVSRCNCQPTFSGQYCENKTVQVNNGEIQTGFLDENIWNYYTYQSNSQDNIVISVNQTDPIDGDCDVYVRFNAPPSRFEFDYIHITIEPSFSLTVPNSLGKILYIGIFGWRRVGYRFSIYNSPACIPDCGIHGQCLDGLCICNQNWAGAACDQPSLTLQSTIPVSTNISMNQWHYYNFVSTSPTVVLALREDTQNPLVGFLYVLVSEEVTPNLAQYDHGDFSLTKHMHLVNIFLDDRQGETINWMVSVYGTGFLVNPISYQLVVWDAK
jgi:hypothetical protein